MNILLVEPTFPLACKSKNHRDFLPIGLLKYASYHREKGDEVRLIRGNKELPGFFPEEIKITSLFTYWSRQVWESVKFYKDTFPKSKIIVGGIYASLMPDHCKRSGCDEVFIGVDERVEKYSPAYDLVDIDYQILHSSRGCKRKCKFCGTWKIEPTFTAKTSIKNEICSNRIIFYDNNLLANPHIENILNELKESKIKGRAVYAESQCGIDGRLLTLKLAKMLKEARFRNPRIAWDHGIENKKEIKDQITMLVKAGYPVKDIYVFMIYNFELEYNEMMAKLMQCKKWGVQIADCRYRPLNQTFDNYKPRSEQTNADYFIHPKWTDEDIKSFRRSVRQQNITIRHGFETYDKDLELAGKRRRSCRPA